MRKRGNNTNTNTNGNAGNLPLRGSNGSSLAVSKLLSQQQPYRDGQTVILDVREPVLAGSNHNNNKNHAINSSNGKDDVSAQLNAKNHRLAKELSEVRVRHREECKNVTRLTMENMSLASRCREAITQAANMKKDLSLQKRKTAEAVAQTHVLLDQLKKMKYALNALEAEKAKHTDPTASSRNSSSPQQEQHNVANSSVVASPGVLIDGGKSIDPSSNLAAIDFLDVDSAPSVASEENDTQELQVTPNNHTSTKKQLTGNSGATTTTVASTISSTSDVNDNITIPIIINRTEMLTTDHRDVKLSSNSPSSATTETIVRGSPASASDVLSKVSNIIDLDISLDDDQPSAPITLCGQDIVGQSPLSPIDTQINVGESHFDNVEDVDDINRSQNGSTVKSSILSDEQSEVSNNINMLTTKLDDNFVQGNANSSQYDNEVQTTKSTNVPMATRVIMEENFDDSEHKSEDDIYLLPSSTNNTVTLSINDDIVTQNSPLISSDDYETSLSYDIDDTKVPENRNTATSNSEDQSVAVLALLVSTSDNHVPEATILKSELEMNGSNSKILDNDTMEMPVDDKVSGTVSLAEKESNINLSWVEDYDEAAELIGDETYDTLSGLKSPSKRDIFPYSASPKISISSNSDNAEFVSSDSLSTMTKRFALPPSSLNDSYEEEFPSDIIDPHSLTSGGTRHNKLQFRSSLMNTTTSMIEEQVEKGEDDQESFVSPIKLLGPLQERAQSNNLLSSIDAFEASFRTNFPDSFTSKDSPVTSPTSGRRPVKDIGVSIANNTYTSNLSDEKIDQKHIVENVAEVDKTSNDTFQKPAEIAKSWGGAMNDRATFTSQRSSARRSSKTINSMEEPNMNSLSTSKSLSPSQKATYSPIVNGVSDQSARWLMEVKASTAKNKFKTESMVDEAICQLQAAKLDPEKGVKSAGSTNSVTTLNRNNTNRQLFSINTALQSELSNQNEPVFRQFPRTASPVKQVKHAASRNNRIDFIDDAFSESMSDRAPLLRGRNSDEYESPPSATSIQQKNKNGGSATSDAKARYMDAIGQQGSTSISSNSGRSFASRKTQIPKERNSVSLLNLEKDSTDAVASASMDGVNITAGGIAIPAERKPGAALQSSPDSIKKALNSNTAPYSNNYMNRSNGRGALRATVMLLEDEGDIPMETNLSPRKLRNDDHSKAISCEKEKASSPEQDSSFSTRLDTALRNHQRLKVRAHASAWEGENRATLNQFDVGKQRRHINLSGTGRLIRQVDPENNTSPIYDIGHRDEKLNT